MPRHCKPMAHEALHREAPIEGSSNRSFGFVFAVVFLIIALWPLMSARPIRLWAAAIAIAFAVVALAAPSLLAGMNRAWMKFGLLLGRVVSPIALGVLFFAAFTPMGLLVRLLGKDSMRLKKPVDATTYWVERRPPGPPPESLKNQY